MIKAICFDAFGTICYYNMSGIHLFPETADVLENLKNKGLKLGIISNISKLYAGFLVKKIPFEMDCVSFPQYSGTVKPNAIAFHYACSKLELKPQEVLMVGDSYNNDYMGAKNAGLKALFLDTKCCNKTHESISTLKEVTDYELFI